MKWERTPHVHVTNMDEFEKAAAAVDQLAAQESHARAVGRRSVIDALTSHGHAFSRPVPHRYDHNTFAGALDAPGDVDSTGFSNGIV